MVITALDALASVLLGKAQHWALSSWRTTSLPGCTAPLPTLPFPSLHGLVNFLLAHLVMPCTITIIAHWYHYSSLCCRGSNMHGCGQSLLIWKRLIVVTIFVKKLITTGCRCVSLTMLNFFLLWSSQLTKCRIGRGWLNLSGCKCQPTWTSGVKTMKVICALGLLSLSLGLPITSSSFHFLHKVCHFIKKFSANVIWIDNACNLEFNFLKNRWILSSSKVAN